MNAERRRSSRPAITRLETDEYQRHEVELVAVVPAASLSCNRWCGPQVLCNMREVDGVIESGDK